MANKRAAAESRRIFVLDANVLIDDPAALFRFDEHDVHLPMVVLEELDARKKGVSEGARNVRQVSRFIHEMMHDATKEEIDSGIAIAAGRFIGDSRKSNGGRLFFQTRSAKAALPDSLPGNGADNSILTTTLALQEENADASVTLVSKDINLRIKAAIIGIHAEDFVSDKSLDDVDLLFTGTRKLPEDFWPANSQDMESWQDEGRTLYRVGEPLVTNCFVNQFIYHNDGISFDAIVRKIDDKGAVVELVNDYRSPELSVWGITARNREQNYALNLLMDTEIEFITILGAAGTGKTLLSLAAGLAQTLDTNEYREIIMTRVTVPLGEDIGFLPGTEEEKMEPWMGALMDNLEVLANNEEGGEWGRAATNDLLRNRIKIRSLNFMRGRTFLNRLIIIDEAQNLTPKQMKALITRAGPGTKLICIGNIAQIDTPYLTESTCGLAYVVNRFKAWPHSGHITLLRGERSRLADYASETL